MNERCPACLSRKLSVTAERVADLILVGDRCADAPSAQESRPGQPGVSLARANKEKNE